MAVWTLPLEDPGLDLDVAGGKGASLGRLTRAGYAVPPGFVVTTAAYRAAVEENHLDAVVLDAVRALGSPEQDGPAPAAVEAASARIRKGFAASRMPAGVAAAVATAYERLGAGPVAVRSSATAEDLPDLSFAGQQDTFLGVAGTEALLEAVRDCWSSLWTARAVAYRHRAGIPHDAVALAVVVQQLVPADVSGVLFTANPLTGHRGQMSVDATVGLGEALVSGQVEPDHWVVDAATGEILEHSVGSKAVVTEVVATGGVVTHARAGGAASTPSSPGSDTAALVTSGAGTAEPAASLPDEQVRALVRLGAAVAREYGAPQDIEWAVRDKSIWVLQARPITSLYPLPDGAPKESVWLSFGAVQGMLAPMTPLGRDTIRSVLSGVGRLLGRSVDPASNPYLRDAGERLWIRVDVALRNPIGSRLLPVALRFVDPSAGAIVAALRAERGQWTVPRRAGWHTVSSLGSVARHLLPKAPAIWVRPGPARDRLDTMIAAFVQQAAMREREAAAEEDVVRRAAARGSALSSVLQGAVPTLAPLLGPMILPSVAGLRLLTRLVKAGGDTDHGVAALVMEVTRALPRNVTTEMDLALWDVAEAVRADAGSLECFLRLAPADLAERYAGHRLPPAAQSALAGFLRRYGMRGVGEIDLGRRRWREEPIDVTATVQRYLALPPQLAPPVVFAGGEQAAQRAVAELAATAAASRGGRLRAAAVRWLAGRIRALAGARESPKFAVVQAMGVFRDGLLASGRDLVAAGLLEEPEDVFLLALPELQRLPSLDAADVRDSVARRRAARASEMRRGRVPRVLVGDGRAFYEGLGQHHDGATIAGSAVSPGVVEAVVRVVHDPASAELLPGEVLVCRGTDPAWTPLFLTAGGLVTEVGGMMTHGSVVAREYGIPAVVGVHEATTRLRTGQRIRLDGSAGTITVMPEQ